MNSSFKYLSLLLAVSLLIFGCDELFTEENGVDPEAAKEKIDEATSALENEFYALINMIETDEIDHPGDIDFTLSNGLFREAIELDPDNVDAHFGAGLTELLVFTHDPDVQAVFDAWEAFLDTGSAFVADTGLSSLSKSLSVGMLGSFPRNPFLGLRGAHAAASYLNLFQLAVSDPPTIDDIQAVIESAFLPRLDYALERFDIADDHPDYTFTITPKMQGNLEEDPVELDLTELYVLETAANLIRSFSSVVVAYSFGPAAYDSAAIIDFLSQGSGFLSLRSNGAAQMGNAAIHLLAASHALDNAVDFLQGETDDQSDDIITVDSMNVSELDSITHYNGKFREDFLNGFTLTEDWNDDGIDTELTFNLSTLFDNPIQDFKSLLPDYTVAVGRDTSYELGEHHDDYFSIPALVDVPTSAWYHWYREHSYNAEYDDEYHEVDTSGFSIPVVNAVVDSLLEVFSGDNTLARWSVSAHWNGSLSQGQHLIYVDVWYSYWTRIPEWSYYTGILAWDAASYSEWTFPNPSFNGLLPDITSDAVFKSTFGITESDFLNMADDPLVIKFDMGGAFLDKRITTAGKDGMPGLFVGSSR